MRYIIVNRSRKPEEPYPCTYCTAAIGKTYLRDLDTRLVYHPEFCYEAHVARSILCIESMGGRESK